MGLADSEGQHTWCGRLITCVQFLVLHIKVRGKNQLFRVVLSLAIVWAPHTHILPHTHIPSTMVIFKTHQIASSSTLNKIPVPAWSCMILHNWASASFFSLNCLSPFFTLCKLWSTLISFGFGDAQSFCLCCLLA